MKLILLVIFTLALGGHTLAQSCNCDITISKEGSYDGRSLGYRAGQTICIKAGAYPYLYFRNIVGTATQPIKIINCGGQVTVGTASGQNGIQFYDSKYVKLTGSGDSKYKYGIKLTKTPDNYSGIVVTGFSSDFEIEKVDVSGTGFAGIMIKYDPTCDPATWRGNFSMYNIKVHDNYLHDTGAEGLYIGNTSWNTGITRTCDGVAKTVYPHDIYGLLIYNNLTERTGAEGIQYACSPSAQVYNNTVKFAGADPFALYQNNGIQASGGVSGRLCNNIIQNAPGHGIIILGHSGTNHVFNNLITNVGGAGIFCDNRPGTPANNAIIFTFNTIVNCGLDGFRLYNELDRTTLTNNAVIQAATGKLLLTSSGVQVTQQANYYGASLSGALSGRVIDNTYKPLAGSPLVDRGILNSNLNVTWDLAGKTRPRGAGFDIGAYEFQPAGSGRSAAQIDEIFTGEETTLRGVSSFPSPCINEISLKLTNQEATIAELDIYTTQGKQVFYTAPEALTTEVKVQTSHLPTGEYIFQVITSDSRVLSGRFIKQ